MAVYESFPIWKDFYVEVPLTTESPQLPDGEEGAPFFIVQDAPERTIMVYSGIARHRPGDKEGYASVCINDICADYLQRQSLDMSDKTSVEYYAFEIWSYGNIMQARVVFSWDWSYNKNWNMSSAGDSVLSFPISHYYPVKGPALVTVWARPELITPKVRVVTLTGGEFTTNLAAVNRGASSEKYGFDFPLIVGPPCAYNFNFRSGFAALPAKTITLLAGGKEVVYYPAECARYTLYYMNAYGGWDWLVLDGLSRGIDIDRHTVTNGYKTSVPTSRGAVNYLNELEGVYTLRTGWLSDEGSANMWHLTGSTNVMLYDQQTEEWTPVVITDKSTKIKTFREGRKLISYELTARTSRKGIRR